MSSSSVCQVCGVSIHRAAYCCKRCKKLIDRVDTRRKPNREARLWALKQAWDGEGFRCYYSGIRLIENNSKDPRYLTFDHRTPRQEGDVVVAAAAINDMKSDMTEEEFKRMIILLANHFNGGSFDKGAFDLKHWKR